VPKSKKMLLEINNAWSWKGFIATEVILTNDFGNVIFKTEKNDFWRICPEELTCERIADNNFELEQLLTAPEFDLDWQMSRYVNAARNKLGRLENEEKYCLKVPGVLGGDYNDDNFGKIGFSELLSFSGDAAFQIKDLKDGDKFEIETRN